MTRTYQVKYKSKSKMLTTPEAIEDTKKTILEVPRVKSVELKDDGQIEFKTDNVGLFDFSLEEIDAAGWNLDAFTRDLHHDDAMNEGNIMTEYEEKFSSRGNPICKLITSRNIPL